jgi:hypothetical protein
MKYKSSVFLHNLDKTKEKYEVLKNELIDWRLLKKVCAKTLCSGVNFIYLGFILKHAQRRT